MDALSHDIARYGRRRLRQINYQFRICWKIVIACGGDVDRLRGLYDTALDSGPKECAGFMEMVHSDSGFVFMDGVYAFWHRDAMPRNCRDLNDMPAVCEYRRVGGWRPGAQVSLVFPSDRGNDVIAGNTGLNVRTSVMQEGRKFWLMDFKDFLPAVAVDMKRQPVDCGKPGWNSGLDIDLDLF